MEYFSLIDPAEILLALQYRMYVFVAALPVRSFKDRASSGH